MISESRPLLGRKLGPVKITLSMCQRALRLSGERSAAEKEKNRMFKFRSYIKDKLMSSIFFKEKIY
jgi:hypothetical protein